MLRGTINRSILGFAERIWGRMKAVTTDDCDYLEDLRKNQMGNVCVACALCYCLVTFRTNIWYAFQNKYKENYEKAKGQPYAITSDTPELRRIKKVQDQLSEVGCIPKVKDGGIVEICLALGSWGSKHHGNEDPNYSEQIQTSRDGVSHEPYLLQMNPIKEGTIFYVPTHGGHPHGV